MPTPEELARINIDRQLQARGWIAQSRREANLYAGRCVAIREFPLDTGEVERSAAHRGRGGAAIRVKQIEATVDAGLARAARLRQAVLKAEFEERL